MKSPFWLKLYLLKNLPLAFIAGLSPKFISNEKVTVEIKYNYLNRNPFRSIYFAALSMAAELSTGILAMIAAKSATEPVSLIVTSITAVFHKKAKTKVIFTCEQGLEFKNAVHLAISGKEPSELKAYSKGAFTDGTLAAEFWITWSFKARNVL
ncbi:MAG: DUF4442 domain-containing protein [Bacteroidales bacterium]